MKNFLKWFIGLSYIPASFAIYVVLHNMGFSEFWVFYAGTGLLILMSLLLEHFMPWEKSWCSPDDQLANEFGHTFVSALVGHNIGGFLAYALIGAAVAASPEKGAPWWPSQLPLVMQVVIAFCIWDLSIYLNHRLMHGVAWKFHVLHHKLRRLSWLNSGYGHPMQFVLTSLSGLGVLYLCGLPREVVMYSAYMTFALNFLPHANIDMEMGFLNYIFATPKVHRWHHITEEGKKPVNFGMQLIIWDHVFRTFYLPKADAKASRLGDPTPLAAGFFAQWLEPFVPQRIKQFWSPIPKERQPFTVRESFSRKYEAS